MFYLILFCLIIYVLVQKYSVKTVDLLNAILAKQQYANIRTIYRTNALQLIAADNNGENFLFALKNTTENFYLNDIIEIQRVAQLNHFHNVILVTIYSGITSEKAKAKIKELEYKVWNSTTLKSMGNITNGINTTQGTNTTRTTNTTQSSSYDPIQYNTKTSWIKNLFKGPDRL